MGREYLSMNRDDERASRAFALAVRFFGSSYPLSSDVLNAEFYPTLSHESFSRAFLRDRDLLSSCGLHIRDASEGKGSLWEVDEESSYSSSEGLEGPDALALAILCQDLSHDPSFAWRGELRMALTKIGYATQGVTSSRKHHPPHDPKCLTTLVSCHANRHLVQVTYRNAKGIETQRTLALYGSFGLRGHTYFVAARTDKVEGDSSTGQGNLPKTYRLDRFVKVRELPHTSYRIPEDFDADDYRKLPFQIGPQSIVGSFALPENPGRTLLRSMGAHGTVRKGGSRTTWDVPIGDISLAAAWAIGEQAVPIAPAELIDAYHDLLQGAYTQESSPARDIHPHEHRRPQRQSGRSGGSNEARQLVALASNLTTSGRVLTSESISSALGIDDARARHLITLLSMTSGESIDYLPVIVGDDDDTIELMEGANLAARRVRLTPVESHALLAALSELGISEDDSLRRSLVDSYASRIIDQDEILRTLEAPRIGPEAEVLALCSRAIAAHHSLRFSYVPVSGGPESQRHVLPLLTRRGDEAWYLEAFDLVREGRRVFRVDHMSQVDDGGTVDPNIQDMPSMPQREQDTRIEEVTFSDRRFLDLFDWDAIEVIQEDADGIHCLVPRYHGPWLTRHIAACGGKALCGEEMTHEVHDLTGKLIEAREIEI